MTLPAQEMENSPRPDASRPTGGNGDPDPIAVQIGAEAFAPLFQKPDDPWENPATWRRVLGALRYVVPEREVAGLNQAAVFLKLGLVAPGQVLVDGYAWQGIPEMPGYTLFHAAGKWAWFMVLADDVYDEAVTNGQIQRAAASPAAGARKPASETTQSRRRRSKKESS